jgi:hypothetical protein
MAAVKKRQASFPQAVFEILLEDAIADLIQPLDREVGDLWNFHVDGEILRITRIRAPIEEPVDPGPPAAPQAGPAARKATRVR